jgi:hypothetical protein
MLVKTDDDQHDVWIFNNAITSITGQKIEVPVSTLFNGGDTLVLASRKGLYLKRFDTVSPLVYFKNAHQTIKEKDGVIDFPFEPRSMFKIAPNKFIVGGMWGGLYEVDISSGKLTCLDDIDYDRIDTVELNAL